MAIKRSVGEQKRRRKTPPKGRVRSVPLTPKESAVSAELSGAFDPRPYLSKLATGKTSREYKAAGPIFSQGDTADAVFYVDSGKVKLTVVSTSGKEAVIGILPEGSFFGEGCLAGQPIRIATRNGPARVHYYHSGGKRDNGQNAPPGAGICRALSGLFAFPQHPHGSRPRGSAVQFQRKAPRTSSPAAGQLRPGIKADTGCRKDKSGDPRRDDRHHAFARQLLHESFQEAGLRRLQRRRLACPQFAGQRRAS